MTEPETARLLLRQWRNEDIASYARICADPEVMRYLSGAMTRDQAAKQMERWMRHWEERVISIIHPENVASRRVAEKAGLTLRGETHLKGYFVIWYAIDRREWDTDGPSPSG